MRIDFTQHSRPRNVGLGDVQQGNFIDGKWVVTRQIAGDDDAQGEILMLRPYTILRVTLYRFHSEPSSMGRLKPFRRLRTAQNHYLHLPADRSVPGCKLKHLQCVVLQSITAGGEQT